MEDQASARRCGVVVGVIYAALALLIFSDQWGRATSDTRFELVEDPVRFLAATFSLWNPDGSLGEVQNQAYGYLFPQGSFFALLDVAGVPGWVTQRLWSVLVLVVACEGARRVARRLELTAWPAAVTGFAYALTPRMLGEVTVRSADVLPMAVLPWALLPLLAAIDGRRRPRDAAVLSAAAFACSGGVNGTSTAAPAALLLIVVGWAVWRRHLSWRFALGWTGLMAAVSAWWLVALFQLGAISPPFYDYVEDAPAVTDATGFSATLRGADNWVGYLTVGGRPWWPGAYDVSVDPWVVLGSGLVAALGLIGILRWRGAVRGPLLLAAAVGLALQVVAHDGPLASPIAAWLRDLLDGALVPLRNVHKVDPVLRLPLALGLGFLVQDLVALAVARHRLRWRGRLRRLASWGLLGVVTGSLVLAAAPVVRADTRTPGWTDVPDYWHDAASYVAEQSDGTTWVLPGSGFALQEWGWTMEEVLGSLARSPWVARSQVPFAPPQTIRMLDTLEAGLVGGATSPHLAGVLRRIGVDTILVRTDLDPSVSDATDPGLVSRSLSGSPGIERVATFGNPAAGEGIDIYAVAGAERGYDVRDLDDVVTVAGGPEDVVTAVQAGLVRGGAPAVLAGAAGWDHPADVVGDAWRLRERSFGRARDAASAVMTDDEPSHTGRRVTDYPGPPGGRPVVADDLGIAGVTASSSQGWADAIGPIRPESGPWSALDGDRATAWRPGPFLVDDEQWWEVRLDETTEIGEVTIQEPSDSLRLTRTLTWAVVAGGERFEVEAEPVSGRAAVDLGGLETDRLRIEVARAEDTAIGIAEVEIEGVGPERTLVVPEVATVAEPTLVFTAQPELRACVTTLLGADCALGRQRSAEESAGIDRTFTLAEAASFELEAQVVARAVLGTSDLTRRFGGAEATASSWLAEDPAVGARMAFDRDPATWWVADPRDRQPTLTLDLGRRATIRGLSVEPPGPLAHAPMRAIVAAESGGRTVEREVAFGQDESFAPLTARRITLTFPDAGAEGSLGIGELEIEGADIAVPLQRSDRTGSVCGYGPALVVDGARYRTRVTGTFRDVIDGGRLKVKPCGGTPRRLDLDAGEHRIGLESTQQFQPVEATLSGGGTTTASRSRTLTTASATDTHVVLDVSAGDDAILSAPHNTNAGWEATVDGARLRPIVVDGWAQGWILPADLAGRVDLRFTPQKPYLVALVAGLVLLGLVLLAALAVLVLSREKALVAPRDVTLGPTSGHSWSREASLLAAATATGLLVGGPLVALAAAAGVVVGRWPRVVQGTVGLALVVALALLVADLADRARYPSDAVDLVTGAAVALGLAAAVASRRDRAQP